MKHKIATVDQIHLPPAKCGTCHQPQPPEDAVVHVVDDNEQFRTGIRLLLQSAGFQVEPYRSADHFLCVYQPCAVECLVLDLQMPGMNGLELQQQLNKRRIHIPLIVISAFANTSSVVQAVQNGAIDVLEKPVEDCVLIKKVNTALEYDRTHKLRSKDLRARLTKLSEREYEVMDQFIAAKTTKQIAHELNISPKTVEKHRIHIFEKLNVSSVPEIMQLMMPINMPSNV